MGNPRAGNLGLTSAGRRRLVVMQPFFLDAHEVTVADYRRDGKVYAGRFSGSYAGRSEKDWCTFTEERGDHEALPVNCVRWEKAREYCQERRADLPTEAAYEYAASAFGTSLYPWGNDAPECTDAVWGRSGGGDQTMPTSSGRGPCRPRVGSSRDILGYPAPVDRLDRGRDEVVLPDGSRIWDLAGNVREWQLDVFAVEASECWDPRVPNVLVNPRCDMSNAPFRGFSVRGTAFFLPALFAVAALRTGETEGVRVDIGFRCARPG